MRAYAEVDHGQLHYRSNMRREAPPLLLLHQSPSDSRMYEALMAELDEAYWLIAPDNPGFGNSDPLPGGFGLQGCARAIARLLDLLGIDHALVFGHHTGASIAVQLAAERPALVAKLALCGPTLLDGPLKQALPGLGAQFPLAADGSHLVSMWQRMSAKEGDTAPEVLLREVLAAFNAGDAYPQAYASVAEQDFESQLRAITVPIMVCAGTADVLYPQLEESYQCLQQGEKVEFEGAGSYICDHQAPRLAQALQDFFGDGPV